MGQTAYSYIKTNCFMLILGGSKHNNQGSTLNTDM